MRFGVLGPIAAWTDDGGTVPIQGAKVRALLADLVVHLGQPVAGDRLVDDLWGESPDSTNPAGLLSSKVSQLRRALDAAEPGARALVVSPPPGYTLAVEATAVDAGEFAALVDEAGAAEAADPARAVALLERALALWRGPAYGEVADLEFARGAVAQLDERRLTAHEALARARLALGSHARVADELTALVEEHPWREDLRLSHVLALYRAGRQPDALASFERYRRHLVDELGIDPSPAAAALHHAVLVQDPALAAPAPAGPAPAAEAVVGPGAAAIPPARRPPSNLPGRRSSLIGRDDDLAALVEAIGFAHLVTLVGPGGVGKTTLALEAARHVAGDRPDGAWFVDLSGVDRGRLGATADVVADQVTAALAIRQTTEAPSSAPSVDRLGAALRGHDALLGARQLRARRGGGGRRRRPAAARRPRGHRRGHEPRAAGGGRRAGAHGDPPRRSRAAGSERPRPRGAVRRRATVRRPGAGGRRDDRDRAAHRAPARHPLPAARRTAAGARAGGDAGAGARPVRGRGPPRGPVPPAGVGPARRSRASAHPRSDARLELGPARRRRAAGPAPAGRARGRVHLGGRRRGLPRRARREGWRARSVRPRRGRSATADVLGRLVERSLVVADHAPDGTRYRLLESVGAYAGARLVESGESDAVRRRHLDWYAVVAEQADAHLRGSDQAVWLAALDAESANMQVALDTAADLGLPDLAHRLVAALGWYWMLRGRTAVAVRAFDRALSLAPEVPTVAHARAVCLRQAAAVTHGETTDLVARSAAALAGYEALDAAVERGRSAMVLGTAAIDGGLAADGESLLDEAAAVAAAHGDRWGEAAALLGAAVPAHMHGDLDLLRHRASRSEALFVEVDDAWGRLAAGEWLGALAELEGDLDTAEKVLASGLDEAERLGLWRRVASRLGLLAWIAHQREDRTAARDLADQALRLAVEQADRPLEVLAVMVLGYSARQSGELADAEAHLRSLLDGSGVDPETLASGQAEVGALPPHVVTVLTELGFVAELGGDPARALALHQAVVAAAVASGYPRVLAGGARGRGGRPRRAGRTRGGGRRAGRGRRRPGRGAARARGRRAP